MNISKYIYIPKDAQTHSSTHIRPSVDISTWYNADIVKYAEERMAELSNHMDAIKHLTDLDQKVNFSRLCKIAAKQIKCRQAFFGKHLSKLSSTHQLLLSLLAMNNWRAHRM